MVEALTLSNDAFMQDMAAWPQGARRLDAARVVAVRHFRNEAPARAVFEQAGAPWPQTTLDLASTPALLAARRHPEEIVLVGQGTEVDALLSALAPGREPEAMAIELTDGLGVIDLHAANLDDWLARLVDVSAIPTPGRASRCRFIDVPVFLLRTQANEVLLVADRSLFPYIARWLAFTHEAAAHDA